jgi:UDP-N-acetylmuramyl pentapeptide phosphotransferase/UDP-N-acetylglucosamine-1-phosphate transferase
MPGETAAARKLGEALFYYFAEMTALAGIYDDAARVRHARRFYRGRIASFQQIVILRRVLPQRTRGTQRNDGFGFFWPFILRVPCVLSGLSCISVFPVSSVV